MGPGPGLPRLREWHKKWGRAHGRADEVAACEEFREQEVARVTGLLGWRRRRQREEEEEDHKREKEGGDEEDGSGKQDAYCLGSSAWPAGCRLRPGPLARSLHALFGTGTGRARLGGLKTGRG